MKLVTRWACVSDRYQADEGELYDSVDEFIRMCEQCHGETPVMTAHDGDYYERGERVLEARVIEAPREYAQNRTVRVEMRVSGDERDAWDAAAEKAGQSRSEWLRALANAAAS